MKVKTWTSTGGRVWFGWQMKEKIAYWTAKLMDGGDDDWTPEQCRGRIDIWTKRLEGTCT